MKIEKGLCMKTEKITISYLAEKYNVPTYEDYKRLGYDNFPDLNPIQRLAFTYIYFLHCIKSHPRMFILNHDFVKELYVFQDGKMPSNFEGVPFAHDESQPFKITTLG